MIASGDDVLAAMSYVKEEWLSSVCPEPGKLTSFVMKTLITYKCSVDPHSL